MKTGPLTSKVNIKPLGEKQSDAGWRSSLDMKIRMQVWNMITGTVGQQHFHVCTVIKVKLALTQPEIKEMSGLH